MEDFIKFEEVWNDTDCIELSVTCSSEVITASTNIYVCNELIDNLSELIKQLITGQSREIYWQNHQKCDVGVPCVSFRIFADKIGHVKIEVYMELDDGGKLNEHNCCFYINSELGLLEAFCKKLPKLKQRNIGTCIVLNEV